MNLAILTAEGLEMFLAETRQYRAVRNQRPLDAGELVPGLRVHEGEVVWAAWLASLAHWWVAYD